MTRERPRVLQFMVEIPGRAPIAADLAPDVTLSTDAEGLSLALADTPGKFAWWATLEVEARAEAEQVEQARDLRYAELFDTLTAIAPEGKKPTVEATKAAITRDAQYQVWLTRLRGANRQAGLLGVARRAMEHRKDALLAIASNMRKELDAGMRDNVRKLGTVYGDRR